MHVTHIVCTCIYIHTHIVVHACIHIYTHTYIDTQEINWCESIDKQFKLQSKYHGFDMEMFIPSPTVEELNSLEKSEL